MKVTFCNLSEKILFDTKYIKSFGFIKKLLVKTFGKRHIGIDWHGATNMTRGYEFRGKIYLTEQYAVIDWAKSSRKLNDFNSYTL